MTISSSSSDVGRRCGAGGVAGALRFRLLGTGWLGVAAGAKAALSVGEKPVPVGTFSLSAAAAALRMFSR